jgi:hypothetical protein
LFFFTKKKENGVTFLMATGEGGGLTASNKNESRSFTRSQRETWLNNLTCKKVHGNEIVTNNIGNLREPAAAAASQVSAH